MMKNKKILFLMAFAFLILAFPNSGHAVVVVVDEACTNAGGRCIPQLGECMGDDIWLNNIECSNREESCCKPQGAPSGGTPAAEDDNCLGACKDTCAANEEVSTDPFEYCATKRCCKPKVVGGEDDSCSGACKSVCATFEEVSKNPSDKCSGRNYCCKPKSLAAYTCTKTLGQSCNQSNCEEINFDDGEGTCPPESQHCCKRRADGGGQTPPPGGGGTPNNKGAAGGGTMWDVQSLGGYGLPGGTVEGIIRYLVNSLLIMFGFLGIIAFIISGLFYLTAAGNAEQEKKAKLAMNMGIMGIIVGLIGFVIIQAVDTILNAGM